MYHDDAHTNLEYVSLLSRQGDEESSKFLKNSIYKRIQNDWMENNSSLIDSWLSLVARHTVDPILTERWRKIYENTLAEYENESRVSQETETNRIAGQIRVFEELEINYLHGNKSLPNE